MQRSKKRSFEFLRGQIKTNMETKDYLYFIFLGLCIFGTIGYLSYENNKVLSKYEKLHENHRYIRLQALLANGQNVEKEIEAMEQEYLKSLKNKD